MLINKERRPMANVMQLILLAYILIQPVLDLLVFIGLPVSTLVRAAVIPAGMLYILFFLKGNQKKYVVGYFVLLLIYFGMHTILNYYLKDPFSITFELQNIVKTIYFPTVMFVYYTFFKQYFSKSSLKQWLPLVFTINLAFISLIVFLAGVTDTGKRTYGFLEKEGQTGWFFSGNELSAIMTMILPFVVIYLLRKTNFIQQIIVFFVIVLSMWAMLTVGTKVTLIGVVVSAGLGLVLSIARLRHKQWLNFILMILLIIGLVGFIPSSPIGNNLGLALETSENDSAAQEEEDSESSGSGGSEEIESEDETTKQRFEESLSNIPMHSVLFSGRVGFMAESMQQYVNAPTAQKAFGMGRSGNYVSADSAKSIEMDFFDWFFNFGILGFVILILPFFYMIAAYVRNIVRAGRSAFNMYAVTSLLCAGMGTGAAFIAGHVLSYPGAGLYLALVYAALVGFSKKENDEYSVFNSKKIDRKW
ncbi:O-antigen ligase family protein [Marinococcus sp. PL1-022]|uniref:O-antigen ligase family protein n=1 Tax=Marinococcus sp. PL1-022 TaxID=3095363 RepID=UPI0029C1F15D|nr:O-antigen ligase family protein [Marinococcus sp. PL1-022]MDX6154082.1 O-antigen ligase family protein [Marinococcus sp. PL1-022]